VTVANLKHRMSGPSRGGQHVKVRRSTFLRLEVMGSDNRILIACRYGVYVSR
jgi:hypothetical protein